MKARSFSFILLIYVGAISLFVPLQAKTNSVASLIVSSAVSASASSNIDIFASSNYTLSDAQDITTNYTYQVDTPATTYQLSLHIIQPFPYAHIADTTIITSPLQWFTYQNHTDYLGNTIMTITFQNPTAALGRFFVTVLQHITLYAISYGVDPARVGSYDTRSLVYSTYTQPAPYIQSDNPEIVEKAKEIADGESNPYLVALKIQQFVVQHMTYDTTAVTPWTPSTEGALFALNSGKGVCRHFAALFTALARADGIPTVDVWGSDVVGAFSFGYPGLVVDGGGYKHNWVQFLIPNYGWISADPTLDEFAHLANGHVPEMSVEYTYQRAWSSSSIGTFTSILGPGLEEPVVTLSFQVPEFPSAIPMILVFAIVAAVGSIKACNQGRYQKPKNSLT